MSYNKSIRDLEFSSVAVIGGAFFQYMIPFFQHNHKIESLQIDKCSLHREGGRFLSQALAVCPSRKLQYVEINELFGDDELLDETDDVVVGSIIRGLGSQPELRTLLFENNIVGVSGSMALKSLILSAKKTL